MVERTGNDEDDVNKSAYKIDVAYSLLDCGVRDVWQSDDLL